MNLGRAALSGVPCRDLRPGGPALFPGRGEAAGRRPAARSPDPDARETSADVDRDRSRIFMKAHHAGHLGTDGRVRVQEAKVEMSLKSLSVKLYLGVAVLAGVLWVAGVSGQTIMSLALVGLLLAMHAGGHGGHGGHSSRDAQSAERGSTGHAGHDHRAGLAGAPDGAAAVDEAQPPTRSGCH